MTITRVAFGSFNDVFNAANKPTAPSFLAGDLVLVFTGEYMGADTISTPSGWTLCSPNGNAKQNCCFGLISVTGSEAMPSISWGNVWSYAIVGVYRGVASLTPTNSADRNSNSTQFISGPASTIGPSQDNSLVLWYGSRDKTTGSNGMTFGSLPSGFSQVVADVPNGARPAPVILEWIQGTATAIPANSSIKASIADSTTQQDQGIIMVFAPAVSGVPYPPMNQGGMNVQVCQ